MERMKSFCVNEQIISNQLLHL